MMALLGAPIAHEDAPQRAIWAALGIVEALARFNEQLRAERGFELQARIGINTGPVVVGTVGNDLKMDYTAIGDTTNLAARLQALAEPGTILISETTHRLVRGFFQVRPLGPLAIRGKSERVPAYEVLGRSELATPMAIASERGLTPLVGRAAELAQLEACYRRLGNRAQILSVVGDAGAGKSRLVYEFKRCLAGLVLTESHEAPVVMTIEDLHWMDESSIELLRSLVVRLASARVMVLVTERPDAQTAWPGHVALTRIVLPRLADDDVTAIIRAVAGAPLPAELERRLVEKAEGSPFFAEEMTRALFEEGHLVRDDGHSEVTRPVADIPIPGSVQEVVAARLDRLPPPAKRAVQVAAVLGRQF